MELRILKSLHNYFILHDIKKILNQNNLGGQKIFPEETLPKALSKSTIFQNSIDKIIEDYYYIANMQHNTHLRINSM
jgi:hypothetical protein